MRFAWLLLALMVLPFVQADGLTVTPTSNSLSVNWNSPQSFQLTLLNNNSFPIYNISFSPLAYFSFPSLVSLQPGEARIISYQVSTNQLFTNQVFTSTVSYFYATPFTPPSKSVQVDITASGFSPSTEQINWNDSVVWHNAMAQDTDIKDLGTGFPAVHVPAQQVVPAAYTTVKNYTFYNSPQGFTGYLQVVPQPTTTLAHDSTLDKQVSFSVSSTLANSSLVVNLQSSSIVVNNNQTYPQALVQVRNNDPTLLMQGIHLSADRWVSSNFSANDFNLGPGGVQNVAFDVTPLVTHTADTNTTQYITLTLTTTNSGSVTKQIPVFINYANLDALVVGGNNYTVTVLGINDTISACLQHMNDPGFGECQELAAYFSKNVTLIKEVPAQYNFSEADVANIKAAAFGVGDVGARIENKMNMYLDKQAAVELEVENASQRIDALQAYVVTQEKARDTVVQGQNVRFWVVFALTFLVALALVGAWIAEGVEYFTALEEARQA